VGQPGATSVRRRRIWLIATSAAVFSVSQYPRPSGDRNRFRGSGRGGFPLSVKPPSDENQQGPIRPISKRIRERDLILVFVRKQHLSNSPTAIEDCIHPQCVQRRQERPARLLPAIFIIVRQRSSFPDSRVSARGYARTEYDVADAPLGAVLQHPFQLIDVAWNACATTILPAARCLA